MPDEAFPCRGRLGGSSAGPNGGARPSTPGSPAAVRPRAATPAQIVVVEDEPLLASNLARFLAHEGHGATVAGTLAAGLECCRRHPPDLVIVDQTLPDGTGVGLVCRLRGAGFRGAVVLVTAHASADLTAAAARAGVDVSLTKPVSLACLGQVVRLLVQDGRSAGPDPQ